MGMGDYKSWLANRLVPAEGFPKPLGITDAPVQTTPAAPATLDDVASILNNQNQPMQPLLRAMLVDSTGETMDWSAHGTMTRIMIRNKGPNSVWFAFDTFGQSVVAATSDLSWELQSQEALSIERCTFNKIGLKSPSGGTVHAIAFPDNSGANGGAIG